MPLGRRFPRAHVRQPAQAPLSARAAQRHQDRSQEVYDARSGVATRCRRMGLHRDADCAQRTGARAGQCARRARIAQPTICTSGASRPNTCGISCRSSRRSHRARSASWPTSFITSPTTSATSTTSRCYIERVSASATPMLIDRAQREKLQDKAFALGERLYADKSKTFLSAWKSSGRVAAPVTARAAEQRSRHLTAIMQAPSRLPRTATRAVSSSSRSRAAG